MNERNSWRCCWVHHQGEGRGDEHGQWRKVEELGRRISASEAAEKFGEWLMERHYWMTDFVHVGVEVEPGEAMLFEVQRNVTYDAKPGAPQTIHLNPSSITYPCDYAWE